MPLPPFWADLPDAFKKKVVSHLDLTSRVHLGLCSSEDQLIVRNCPVFLEQVIVFITLEDVTIQFRDHFNESQHKFYRSDDVKSISKLLEITGSTVDTLTFNRSEDVDNNRLEGVIEQFQEALGARLNVKSLVWNCNCRAQNDFEILLILLKIIDPSTLQNLVIRHPKCWKVYDCYYADNSRIIHSSASSEEIQKLVETEHWKELKKVHFHGVLSSETVVEHFLKLEKFRVDVKEWSVDMTWKVIENFRAKTFPRLSYFKIYNIREDFPLEKMLENLETQNLEGSEEVTDKIRFIQGLLHAQAFSIPQSPELQLLVLFEPNKVRGIICQKDSLREDCQSSHEFVM